ncbi:DUF349 domain-containing protein [Ihuprevotella massiliensis]|uniref:DUF349 domain-containing protein n=1 Tax=Ihuprevotella massiliensis TaxID=1852368 RepID=UPI00094E7970
MSEHVDPQLQVAATEHVANDAASNAPLTSPEAVIAQLKLLLEQPDNADRNALDACRSAYYRLHNEAVAKAREQFLAEGGEEADFVAPEQPLEAEYKQLLANIKVRRAEMAEKAEAERQANLARKLAIIEQIKGFAADAEQIDKNYDTFKALQAEWKEIGTIPAEHVTDTWKNYHHYVEQCYDLLRINHEMREYDFKKNLEIKTRICEAAEKLTEQEDVISAFHQLQQLHAEFRETGPVAKELRDEVWNRFKTASTIINKRHQDFFLAQKQQEEDNLLRKTALCERVEAIDLTALHTMNDWEAQSKEIVALQAEWKTVGYAPRKANQQIFDRFRAACDLFFTAKSKFYKEVRETLAANLAKKTALCEKAEQLSESTDWAATTKALVELQAEWKTIGAVAHKASDAIWKRFNTACNAFFDRKKAANASGNEEEVANLAKKQDIIARLEQLIAEGSEKLHDAVKALQAEWNEVGHVPFKKKEKVYRAYRKACDTLYATLHEQAGRRRIDNLTRRVVAQGGNERQRLQRAYDEKKAEIATYETNLSFLTTKSKSGSSFVADVERRIELLKKDLTLLAEKIAQLGE